MIYMAVYTCLFAAALFSYQCCCCCSIIHSPQYYWQVMKRSVLRDSFNSLNLVFIVCVCVGGESMYFRLYKCICIMYVFALSPSLKVCVCVWVGGWVGVCVHAVDVCVCTFKEICILYCLLLFLFVCCSTYH